MLIMSSTKHVRYHSAEDPDRLDISDALDGFTLLRFGPEARRQNGFGESFCTPFPPSSDDSSSALDA
jgi:hypothetical protein